MGLPTGALSTGRPSRRARICYSAARVLVEPPIRRYLTSERHKPVSDRLSFLGRGVRNLSRLQRVRPFRGFRFDRHTTGAVTVETVRAPGCVAPMSEGVVLYFHGGGFFCGNLDSHLHVVARIARLTNLPVVHVDYRQHPEVAIDMSIQDCVDAYRWLLEEGVSPTRVVVAGDSAGGFLAFATLIAGQRTGLAVPAGVIGISPLLELDSLARKSHENFRRDPFGVASALPLIVECIHPAQADVDDLSPLNADLKTLPPALIIVAESEVLRCDVERMCEGLTAAGRQCTVQSWPHQLHAFPALLPFLPESRAVFESMTTFIETCLANPPHSSSMGVG